MKLNLKILKETMENLYKNDKKSYYDLLKAIWVLHNFALIDERIVKVAIKKNQELFDAETVWRYGILTNKSPE